MGSDRHPAALRLAQRGVGRHHADRGVQRDRFVRQGGQRRELARRGRAELRCTCGVPRQPCRRINHQSNRVGDDHGTDHNPVTQIRTRGADTALESSGPRSDTGTHGTPFGRIACEFCCSVTEFGVGTALPGTHRQIEDDRPRDDGHGATLQSHSPALLLQPAHHPIGGGQSVGATAGEHNGVDRGDGVGRIEQIGFTCSGSSAAYVDRAGRPRRRQHHGGAGRPARSEFGIGIHPLVMSHQHSRNVGDRTREQAHTADFPINASTNNSCITVSQ